MKYLLSAAIILFTIVPAQITLTGYGSHSFGENKSGYLYSESTVNVFAISGPYNSWFQLEYSNPPELGRPFNGLRKFRLEYLTTGTQVKLGDIYDIWGRGLILNQFENPNIDFDNSIRGLSFQHNFRNRYDFTLLAGLGDHWTGDYSVQNPKFDGRVPNYRRQHRVIGTNLDYRGGGLSGGVSYLQSRERHPWGELPIFTFISDTIDLSHRAAAARIGYSALNFDVYTEYMTKNTFEFIPDSSEAQFRGVGQSLYGNANIYGSSWSVSLEFKKFTLTKTPPGQEGPVGEFSGLFDYQSPPTALREITSQLAGKLSHPVNFNDEIGYQVQALWYPSNSVNALFNYSLSSRNDEWYQRGFDWADTNSTSWLPIKKFNSLYFEEAYFELSGFSGNDRFQYQAGFSLIESVPLLYSNAMTDSTQRSTYEKLQALSLPFVVDYSISDRWSIDIKYEYQELRKENVFFQREGAEILADTAVSLFEKQLQYNGFLSVGISKSPQFGINLIIDASSTVESNSGHVNDFINPLERFMSNLIEIENRWIAIELLWNLTPKQKLLLTYGSQQGGIICSNGICREIAPFNDGLRLLYTVLL